MDSNIEVWEGKDTCPELQPVNGRARVQFIAHTQIHSLKNLAAYLVINFLIMTYPGGKTIIFQLAFEVDIA